MEFILQVQLAPWNGSAQEVKSIEACDEDMEFPGNPCQNDNGETDINPGDGRSCCRVNIKGVCISCWAGAFVQGIVFYGIHPLANPLAKHHTPADHVCSCQIQRQY